MKAWIDPLLCRLFGHRNKPREKVSDEPVALLHHHIDGTVHERTVPASTYIVSCSRCGEVVRGEVVFQNGNVIERRPSA